MPRQLPIVIIPLFFLICFFYYPLVTVLRDALISESNVITLSYLIAVLFRPLERRIIFFTFYQAILSSILTLLFGLPGAYIFAKFDFPGKALLKSLITIPFVLPSIVVAFGFLMMFGPYGYINQALMYLMKSRTPVLIIDGLILILLAHVFYNVPIVIQMVSSSWERIDPSLDEAAESLGSRGLHKFFNVTLPQIYSSILSSALLTFIFCFLSFTIVITLGGVRYRTIEVHIYSLYKVFFEYHLAAALALVQILISLTFIAAYTKYSERVTKEVTIGRVERIETKPLLTTASDLLTPSRMLIVLYFLGLFTLFGGPIFGVIYSSIYDPISKSISLDGYYIILNSAYNTNLGTSPFNALTNSLVYAVGTLFISVLFGIFSSYTVYRIKIRGRSILTTLVLLPLGVSTITVSLGLVRAYFLIDVIYENLWFLILMAHVLVAYPFSMRAISNALARVDPDLLDAAKSLGASDLKTFLKVELPIIAPGIIVASIFSFAISIGEMAATLFLATPNYITIPVSIYLFIGVRKFTAAGAMGVFLLIICTVAFLLIQKIGKSEISGGF